MPKRFSASSAAQLMSCPGSANLELAIPGYIEPVRDDMAGAKGVGTNVHEALEVCSHWSRAFRADLQVLVETYAEIHWRKRYPITDSRQDTIDWILDEMSYLGNLEWSNRLSNFVDWFQLIGPWRLPPAMLRFISETMLYMLELKDNYKGAVHPEYAMIADWLESSPRTTADVVINGENTLVVVDYKSGKIPVSVVDNDQLYFYAYSAYRQLESSAREVKIVVLQPGNQDEITLSITELEGWALKAQAADRKIIRKDLTLRPSDHCTYCPANPHTRGDKANKMCPAMMAVLYPPTIDEDEILDM